MFVHVITSFHIFTSISETRAKKIVQQNQLKNVQVKFLVHPSPASPAANAGWADLALKTLTGLGVLGLLLPPTPNPGLSIEPKPACLTFNSSTTPSLAASMTSGDISSLSNNFLTKANSIPSNHIFNVSGHSKVSEQAVNTDNPFPPSTDPSPIPYPLFQM
jgi:hypothetical protein